MQIPSFQSDTAHYKACDKVEEFNQWSLCIFLFLRELAHIYH